jgi:hypothetical protein
LVHPLSFLNSVRFDINAISYNNIVKEPIDVVASLKIAVIIVANV